MATASTTPRASVFPTSSSVRRERRALRRLWRGVEYQSFPVARGVQYVPGLDISLSFTVAAPGERVTMAWDSVDVVAPAVARLVR